VRLVWIVVIVVAGIIAGALFTRLETTAPAIRTREGQVHVGREYSHEFRVFDNGMGVRHVRVWVESGGQRIDLVSETYEGNFLMGASLGIARRVEVTFSPVDLGLDQGPAVLSAEAEDWAWRPNFARVDIPLVVDSEPPRVSVHTGLTYVRRGGSEMVVYSLSEPASKHGVQIGDAFSPGFRHPADPERFLAFYPLPPDTPAGGSPSVIAQDRAGNRTRVGLLISIIERTFPEDNIGLSDSFLAKKVPELLGGEQDDLLAGYLQINRNMRRENGEQIQAVCEASSEERLWRGIFQQLPNSHVGARFAEKRSYKYQGREVDQQLHMGYDLASTSHAPIPAANSGVVVYADELGIYGMTVIIDHGMSLFSLYGHMSEVAVEKGQVVAQGEEIGKTGTTGLAGGDHLHYAMMVAGVFVDPLEWFDERWINEHIEVKFRIADTNGSKP
jgi:murein DD-endopeptidase MepM/ murein hydrolase activator NlpD